MDICFDKYLYQVRDNSVSKKAKNWIFCREIAFAPSVVTLSTAVYFNLILDEMLFC
jgi:hypothetical protein